MGRILRMDPEADGATGFFRAIVRLPSDCGLIPGDYVRMEVRMSYKEAAIAVPYESILREDGKPFVFVVSGDIAARRDIAAGEGSGDFVEVPEGISPGERVVKTGAGSLYEGAPLIISDGLLKIPEPVPEAPQNAGAERAETSGG